MFLKENSFKVTTDFIQTNEDSSINSLQKQNQYLPKLANNVVPYAGGGGLQRRETGVTQQAGYVVTTGNFGASYESGNIHLGRESSAKDNGRPL
jgi:hypothetical protein